MYLSVFPRAAPHSRGAGFLDLYHAQRSGAREHLRTFQNEGDFGSIRTITRNSRPRAGGSSANSKRAATPDPLPCASRPVPSDGVRERRTLRTLGRDYQSKGCVLAHRNQHGVGPLCCGSLASLSCETWAAPSRAALFLGNSVIPKACLPII